jgi:hypothetical protein
VDGNSANARTYSFENESVRNQLRNQHRPLAITRLIFSTLLFVMCLGYLLLNAKAIGARFESLQVVMTQADGLRQISMDLTMRGAWAGFFIPMIALGVLVGLGGIVQGLVGMRRTIVARDVPRGFGAPAQVAESFELGGIKGVFPQSPVPLPIGFGALKQASMMLTPAMVGVAQLLASSIGRGVLMAVIALLGTAATVWMGAQSTGPNSAPSLPSPVVCGLLVLALIASVVLSVVVLRMLMPKQALRERVDTLDQELVGAQKPEMIREYIVQAGRDAMERDGMPNRVEAWLCKSADQVGVGATVNWRSCVLIEQNPNPSEVRRERGL